MIDIEKEREAFSQSHRLKENGIAYFESVGGFAYERREREQLNIDYDFLILIRKLWLTWMQCAESKQAEINDLKAQLERAKKDSKRIDFLSDKSQNVANVMLPTKIVERNVSSLRDAIDEAMMMIEESESESE